MGKGMRVLGVMSGSSLDGLDLVCCSFEQAEGRWRFSVEAAATVPYDRAWRERLPGAMTGSALELARLDRDLGRLIGESSSLFMQDQQVRAELIASHGHTVFHKPEEGLTTQIGSGAMMAAITGLPVVCDLRSKDVALGGQGAPLVPMGERDLFPDHDGFLNLGGIANASFHHQAITGFDVCLCNQALNALALEGGQDFDRNGEMARGGSVHAGLLDRLDRMAFLSQPLPRSLGREHFEQQMLPLIQDASLPLADRMRTVVEHIAMAVGGALTHGGLKSTLITGGGAHNGILIDRIQASYQGALVVPDQRTVDFKEAIIFAYLGLLRWRGEVNTLRSVTGARIDSVGGALYLPN